MSYTEASTTIEVVGLRKAFGATTVLDGVDLAVPGGSVCALLGPNGAGKTTAVRILATLSRPDAGVVRIGDHDVVADPTAVRRVISLTGQFAAVDDDQTARENLVMVGRLWHLDRRAAGRRADELLEQFGLADATHRRVATWSGGMTRRLDLAMGLVGDPAVVFLDEPTTGLDPTSRAATWDAVRALVDRGVTILLTTQYLEEADRLAHQVAVLDGGRIVAQGDPGALKRRVGGHRLDLRLADPADAHRAVAALVGHEAVAGRDGATVSLPSDGTAEQVRAVLNGLAAAGVAVRAVAQHEPTLDDVFAALTGAVAA